MDIPGAVIGTIVKVELVTILLLGSAVMVWELITLIKDFWRDDDDI